VLGSEFGYFLEAPFQTKSFGDYFRRLARSPKRAGDYGVDGQLQTAQPLGCSTHALNPFRGERSLVVGVDPGLLDSGRNSVAHKIEIHRENRRGERDARLRGMAPVI
jgi:hypothetical protein